MLPENLKPQKVFKYFNDICSIPHGSGDMEKIADYCVDFAKNHSLDFYRDDANNVIIYKPASKEFENAQPVILQGHLDMVCQKTSGSDIDFLKDGIKTYVDGDFIKAEGTTLGADNGIAVAMIMAILDDKSLSHPALEAVFTTNEEVGMLGAIALDMTKLKAKKMINMDSEEEDTLTVSCAGGSDVTVTVPLKREKKSGEVLNLTLFGLKGGHSGVEIDKGRVNANMLAGRVLDYLNKTLEFDLISINGGDKGNAITNLCKIELLVKDFGNFRKNAEEYLNIIKNEISAREPDFNFMLENKGVSEAEVLSRDISNSIIFACACAPGGVVDMSAEINGLVETSLNMGILKTDDKETVMNFALRSNKSSALKFLEEKLKTFFMYIDCKFEISGHYPPWEYNDNSELQEIYVEVYKEQFGAEPKVEAIHAGLECGVFSSKIKGMDCIALGPQMFDVHTVNEKLSISSTERIFNLVVKMLEKCR